MDETKKCIKIYICLARRVLGIFHGTHYRVGDYNASEIVPSVSKNLSLLVLRLIVVIIRPGAADSINRDDTIDKLSRAIVSVGGRNGFR